MSSSGTAEPAPAAPGWYGDPWRAAPLRWWDGAQWTPQVAQTLPRRRLPLETPVQTVWVWLVALLPLVSVLLLPLVQPHMALRPTTSGTLVGDPLALVGGPMFFVVQFVSVAATAATVVFSWLDHRALASRGVERPFHWAWSFLGGLVYTIGRAVVLRKVTPRSALAPVIVAAVVYLVAIVVTIAWTISIVAGLFTTSFDPTVVGA
ncbi:DUF2510 domain-containing protein [Leifsonia sp. F6_8S_P_1B]|uniref:DUF2510 domain-containing protein n=1 Tax=Leifsonia williamsii TaxID=3035919 RepID=A0ABT8KBT1_9MICO|nr:DUF2510 domain-containing protein [Leifsonia williamsii]MDN4613799.1 DUF2510 domain-containing protein [Leifsonia williamsii]